MPDASRRHPASDETVRLEADFGADDGARRRGGGPSAARSPQRAIAIASGQHRIDRDPRAVHVIGHHDEGVERHAGDAGGRCRERLDDSPCPREPHAAAPHFGEQALSLPRPEGEEGIPNPDWRSANPECGSTGGGCVACAEARRKDDFQRRAMMRAGSRMRDQSPREVTVIVLTFRHAQHPAAPALPVLQPPLHLRTGAARVLPSAATSGMPRPSWPGRGRR